MNLLRTRQVLAITGLSRMTIYRLERDGQFPPRRRLGSNSVAWIDSEVTEWIAARPTKAIGTIPATRHSSADA